MRFWHDISVQKSYCYFFEHESTLKLSKLVLQVHHQPQQIFYDSHRILSRFYNPKTNDETFYKSTV